uniref:Uncharacterized protein n=1 Tax=Rousettus aegyptiacus TaxID=9407 RepID=A0A7J8E8D8_ROUAE|nr:hypothetical protein HJG63_008102 [Rousettus aegyptiacus]
MVNFGGLALCPLHAPSTRQDPCKFLLCERALRQLRGVGLTCAPASDEGTAVTTGEARCLWHEVDPWELGSNPGDLGPELLLLTMTFCGQRAASYRAASGDRPWPPRCACLAGVACLCVPPPLCICQLCPRKATPD